MRNNDPIFWPDSATDLSLKQQREKNYTDCINILQTQWYQADLDQRFSVGDQDLWGLLFPGVATYRRKIFNFNIINPIIQSVSGHQRATRKSSVVIPVHPEMQKTADQLTKCLYHIHRNGVYQTYSDIFEQGALVQGIGIASIFKDTTSDPISGDIRIRNIDFKSVLIDPYFRKKDLSDCRFIETRQFFGREEAALIYPEFADEILSLPSGSYRDDKFYYMPEVYQIQTPNVIAFDEYWYLSSREALFLVDTETEETQEFSGDEEDLRAILSQFKGRLKVIKKTRPTTRRTIILNDRVLIDEPNPYCIDRYPYAVCLAYFTPDSPYYSYKFRGMVRDMRDAQYLFNRRKVADLDILESQQQGLKLKKGSLVTPDDGYNSGNGRMLLLKETAQMTDVEPMQIIPPSPVMLQMEEMLMNVAHRIAGVDPSAMGIEVDDKAGIISMMRQAATARNLQRIFDQFDEFQINCSEIMVEMIQKNWTYGKVKQVIGEEPTQEFDNKLFFNYGCKVIQGALTETQQQLELGQLMELQRMYPNLDLSQEVIDIMQIQNKDRIKEKLAQQAQAQAQQQQKMAELQMQQIQVDNQTKLSYAASQKSLANEREAKIVSDIAVAQDKLERAHQEDTHALLNLVKAVKEIQSMDITNLHNSILALKELMPEKKETSDITNKSL